MSLELLVVLLLVLGAEFVNGWTDAPNAIACRIGRVRGCATDLLGDFTRDIPCAPAMRIAAERKIEHRRVQGGIIALHWQFACTFAGNHNACTRSSPTSCPLTVSFS